MKLEHDNYHFFWNGPFSQWQHAEFELDKQIFVSAEQAMMYLKAQLFNDQAIAKQIMTTSDPGKQKALGRRVDGFKDSIWDENKEQVAFRINYAKFSQNKGLRRKLFQTGKKLLVEASPVDTIWGIGLDACTAAKTPERDWPGQNLLGKTLTLVRDLLRTENPNESVLF